MASTLKKRPMRDSNFELLRILSMFAIIAHHYVVLSGITKNYNFDHITMHMLFLQLWGMWGKVAINSFVLISGYFMCTSNFKWIKVFKLWLEVKFYTILIYAIMAVMGYQEVNFNTLFTLAFENLQKINDGFIASFLVLYLCIPFLNLLIQNMHKKQHLYLCILCILLFTVADTFFLAPAFHHVGWYIALYFIASYIRLYPMPWMQNNKIVGILLIISGLLAYVSVIVMDYLHKPLFPPYYFVADSDKFLALCVSLFAFLFFKNLKIKPNRFINAVASTTLGVLLIHSGNFACIRFLWEDIFKVPSMYEKPFILLAFHAFFSMLSVFAICACIDLLRIYCLERPLFQKITTWIEKHKQKKKSKELT